MAEFLEDPSVLTKDKLKIELTANNVALPSGEHKKEVYVQLYLKNLTILNNKNNPPTDTFSSDEELPAPVVSNKSRSGRVGLFICGTVGSLIEQICVIHNITVPCRKRPKRQTSPAQRTWRLQISPMKI